MFSPCSQDPLLGLAKTKELVFQLPITNQLLSEIDVLSLCKY